MSEKEHIDGKIIPVKNDVLTVANAISLSRALIAVPILFLHHQSGEEATWLIVAFIAYAFISDYLDGYFARRMNQVTEFGKIADPLADKVCAIILFLYGVLIDIIPAFFVVILIVRDGFILAGSLLIKKKRGKYAMSVLSGKVAVNALAIYWILAFFFPEREQTIHFFMVLSIILLLYSLGSYIHRFYLIQKKGAEYN
ncbi:CDP-alcohol phosphatidyltransferase family protein [Balneolales bacterium ANBcel1]|nr:CDP-alcohol phosphatidyltransferase family protein [Balneolales bacterium ANBcel1]